MITGRALHYVLKIGNRTKTARFFKDILGMKVLRHEEFKEGCEAACNGPYDNRWSKTMVGYGPEDNHFVVELTYNYTVNGYKIGNDFHGITIKSKETIERAKKLDWPMKEENELFLLESPDGYKFYIINEDQPKDRDPVQKVSLVSSDLQKTISYWHDILGLKIINKMCKSVSFAFDKNEALLEFISIGQKVEHKEAFGRIAFSCPYDTQPLIEKIINDNNQKILKPLISLDTPGKATVRVIILADPDDHEICFVDDKGFRQLSQVDPESDALLEKYIIKDEDRDK